MNTDDIVDTIAGIFDDTEYIPTASVPAFNSNTNLSQKLVIHHDIEFIISGKEKIIISFVNAKSTLLLLRYLLIFKLNAKNRKVIILANIIPSK